MYIKPKIIEINSNNISQYIKLYADSSWGCPGASTNYVVGGGCGYAYTTGACTITHNT